MLTHKPNTQLKQKRRGVFPAHLQAAVLVEAANVACVQPALAVERLSGLVGQLVVALRVRVWLKMVKLQVKMLL